MYLYRSVVDKLEHTCMRVELSFGLHKGEKLMGILVFDLDEYACTVLNMKEVPYDYFYRCNVDLHLSSIVLTLKLESYYDWVFEIPYTDIPYSLQ